MLGDQPIGQVIGVVDVLVFYEGSAHAGDPQKRPEAVTSGHFLPSINT
jgi:hypothetical protein